jgi:undecaprenyl-diphosphatase
VTLRLREAVALGAIEGVTEVLPVSSSAHLALIPWLLDWRYARLEPELRKTTEATLHLGAAAGLLAARAGELRGVDRERAEVIVLAQLAPALAGAALQRPLQELASRPRPIAAGLIAGALGSLAGEVLARRRPREDPAGRRDGMLLGAAQATALWPGVSRTGATIAIARARGLPATEARRLSLQVGVPVMAGAGLLTGARLRADGEMPHAALAAGAATALAATLATGRARCARELPVWLTAAHRFALAGWVLRRARG